MYACLSASFLLPSYHTFTSLVKNIVSYFVAFFILFFANYFVTFGCIYVFSFIHLQFTFCEGMLAKLQISLNL